MGYLKKKNKGLLYSFLAGTAVGTGITLLTAPKSGRELRGQISDMADDSFTKVKDYASDAQNKLSETYESGKRALSEKRMAMTSAMRRGKEAISEERERQRSEFGHEEGTPM
ncbi:YtxH domain-containing protein [Geomesophilobacter sediminis]|uniref:YtxH domain-containing protein n=1 Tax=Geomesophilobacter sediminis TaxID=2798584 RepID=A0A8J7LXT6_9BACT|nr:YtxH domain-containing protein [Geomesophilobacter sediminis]MBJ6723712.1 YtxH domain-containing protein [Geomesophilobacter sediminis]